MVDDKTLLDSLQAAWGQAEAVTRPGPRPMAITSLPAVVGGGVATVRCQSHLPPFDAICTPDPKRRGWIRSQCRLCGRFLGYRPGANGIDLESRS